MATSDQNTEYSDEDRLAIYNKAKGKFLANMSFIANLYSMKYLPHKVMRTISYQICTKFTEEYINEESAKKKFSISEVFLEAFFTLMETCGDKIEDKENKDEKAKKEDLLAKIKPKADEWVTIMMKSITSCKLATEELNQKFPENDKKELNFVSVIFSFLKLLKESKKISPRLTSLIENLIENRRNKWKSSVTVKKPVYSEVDYKSSKPSKGGRSKYDDDRGNRRGYDYDDYKGGDDIYYKKSTTEAPKPAAEVKPAKKAIDVNFEVKTIMDDNKKTDDLSVYLDLFKDDNPALNSSSGAEVLKAFLENFLRHDLKVGSVRAEVIPSLIDNFKISEETFFKVFSEYTFNKFNEDDRNSSQRKILLKTLLLAITKKGFDINRMKLTFDKDPDNASQQAFNLSDVLDEVSGMQADLGLDDKLVGDIKQYSKNNLSL